MPAGEKWTILSPASLRTKKLEGFSIENLQPIVDIGSTHVSVYFPLAALPRDTARKTMPDSQHQAASLMAEKGL
jgi:hypothetical protein